MSSGFNTDVRVGDQVFHVQTEDRGPARSTIDTAVYQNGQGSAPALIQLPRILSAQLNSARATCARRVEEQHRAVIEDLRSGALDAEIAARR